MNSNNSTKVAILQNKQGAKQSMQTIGHTDARGEITLEGTT